MPDDTLHIDRFIFTEPQERPDGKGWVYAARSPDDPAEYTGWLYHNTCAGNELQRVLEAVTVARSVVTPNVLRLHSAGHKRPAIGPAQGYLYAVTDRVDPAATVEQALLPQAPIAIQGLVVGLFELVTAIRDMTAFPHSHGWLGPGHCLLRDEGHLAVINPWQGWVEDHQRQAMTTGTSDWQYTWVAPETVFDPSKIDIGSDLFTACAIAFTLATGQPPFDSASALALDPSLFQLQVPNPRELRADIPEGLARILERGLAPTWAERYHRPEELLTDLRAVAQGRTPEVSARPAAPAAAAPGGASPPPVAAAPTASGAAEVPGRAISSSSQVRARTQSLGRMAASASSSTVRRRDLGDHPRAVVGTGRGARSVSETAFNRRGRDQSRSNPLPIIALVLGGVALVGVAIAVLASGGGGPTLSPHPPGPAPGPNLMQGRGDHPRPPADPVGDPSPRPAATPADPERPGTTGARPRGGMFATLDDPVDIADLPPIPDPVTLEAVAVDAAALRPGLELRSYTRRIDTCRDLGGIPVAERRLVHGVGLKYKPRDWDYALAFEGYLRVDEPGVHRFHLTSDDGSILWINGQEVIDNDGWHSPETIVNAVNLTAGYHHVRLHYHQGDAGDTLELVKVEPSGEEGAIGAEDVFHLPGPESPPFDPQPDPAGQLARVVGVSSGKPYGVRTAIDDGVQLYLDRAYRVPALPAALRGGELIVTANNDKRLADVADHLRFELTRPATVYLAYVDSGFPPDWAEGFVATEMVVAGDFGGTYRCYRRAYEAGTVVLGSNHQSGRNDVSQYLVFVTGGDGEVIADPVPDQGEGDPDAVAAVTDPGDEPVPGDAAPVPVEQPADPTPTPTLAPGERAMVVAALDTVLAGGAIPAGLPEAWRPLVADLHQAIQAMPRMLRDHERRLVAHRATVRINRTELEIARVTEAGLQLTTDGGRSAIGMGWDRIPLADLLPAIQTVNDELTPEDRDAVRLVRSARGSIDPKLVRHREALQLLHSEPTPDAAPEGSQAAAPEGSQAAATAPSPIGTWVVSSVGDPGTSLWTRYDRKRQPVEGEDLGMDDPRQHLTVTPSTDRGWFTIATVGGLVLECFERADGAPVIIYERNGEPWQDWRFERQVDGSYAIIGRRNPRALGLSDGGKITCSDFAGLPTQCWRLVPQPGAAGASASDTIEAGVVRPSDPREIVLLPTDADASQAGGEFKLQAAASAATGVAWETITAHRFGSERGVKFAIEPDTPHLTYRFEAVAGETYHLWLRGRLARTGKEPKFCDALMLTFTTPVRFVSDVRQGHIVDERKGDTAEINGWGRTDGWFWCNGLSDDRLDDDRDDRPIRLQFERSGVQELRVFLCEGPHQFDLIWLSTSRDRRFDPNRVPPQAYRD